MRVTYDLSYQILLTLPEISDRSHSWALGRSCLTNLAIVVVVAAGIGTMVLALSGRAPSCYSGHLIFILLVWTLLEFVGLTM